MASDAATLQAKVDKLEVNMDRLQAWLNDLTGTLNVAIDGGTLPSLLKIINQVLATVPVRGYLTQTALLADLTPGDKTVAFAADTQNQYVKSGAPGAGSWTAAGTSVIAGILSRLTSAEALAAQNSTLLAAINSVLRMPVSADFVNKTGYAKAHVTTSSYAPNVVETEDANGLTIAAGAGLTIQLATGVRMAYDMVPGDLIVIEGMVVSGSSSAIGPFIGIDTNTSGDYNSALAMQIWRNAAASPGLYGGNSIGGGNPTYDASPAAVTQPAPFVAGDLLRLEARVKAGRVVNYQAFKNGTKVYDATQATAFGAGRVAMGFVILPSVTVRITKAYKRGFNGDTVYASGSVAASGNGTYWAPFKTVHEARDAAVTYGLPKCKIFQLSSTVGDALIADDALFPEYELSGPLGWAALESAETSPVDFVSLGGASPDVYFRVNKNLAGQANVATAGAVLRMGVVATPATATWYDLPNTYLPYFGGAPADLQGQTSGRRVSGGNLYLRLPSSGSTDPAVANIKVNVSEATLYLKGAPKVSCQNIIFRYGGVQTIWLDRGVLNLVNCGVEWGESNGIQLSSGALYMRGGWVKYVANDCVNRTFVLGQTSPTDTPFESRFEDVELAYTRDGDGWSDHGIEAAGCRSKATLERCRIHDCNKDGLVPASADLYVYDTDIRNCANAQIEVICGNDITLPTGLKSKTVIRGCTLDPMGNGLYGLLLSGFAGGLMDVELYDSWIGTPAAVSGHEIRVGAVVAVSGRTHSAADWVLRYYRNSGTERTAGLRSISDIGSNATLIPVEFNNL